MVNIKDLLLDATESNEPDFDMCKCSSCGWIGEVSVCETEWDQDGFEGERYMIHLCPVCEDGGCIDDYWPSKSEDLE